MNETGLNTSDLFTVNYLVAINSLSKLDIKKIDERLFACANGDWQKVAMVVAKAIHISDEKCEFLEVPTSFFSMRIENLVSGGSLVANGDLKQIRFSEVKQAAQ